MSTSSENCVTSTPSDSIITRYREELERRNYGRATIRLYLRSIRRLFQLMEEQGVALDDLTPELAAELVRGAPWRCDRQQYAIFTVRSFVDYLAEQGVVKPPTSSLASKPAYPTLCRGYEEYLRRQRGLSERTIVACGHLADQFLTFRFAGQEADCRRIVPEDIAIFLQQPTGRKTPYRSKTRPTHLRNFFQYLFKEGLTATNLALCIPRVAQHYAARLPRHLSREQVEAVLTAVRSDLRSGRRNHAMILLLARLGLRAQEVVAIQLDDIDWRAGELVVRGKGQRHDRVPIPPDVGQALVDYIRTERVSTSRTLFVTAYAPHVPFKNGAEVNTILKKGFADTGVTPPCPYVGSHVLRHSLATELVRKGASLAEVGDLLRHRSRASTLIYAKVDIEGLRSVAQAWPGTGGAL